LKSDFVASCSSFVARVTPALTTLASTTVRRLISMRGVKYRINYLQKIKKYKKDKIRQDSRKGNKKIRLFLMHDHTRASFNSFFVLIYRFERAKGFSNFCLMGKLFQCKAWL
jgi:hypothetical protein